MSPTLARRKRRPFSASSGAEASPTLPFHVGRERGVLIQTSSTLARRPWRGGLGEGGLALGMLAGMPTPLFSGSRFWDPGSVFAISLAMRLADVAAPLLLC